MDREGDGFGQDSERQTPAREKERSAKMEDKQQSLHGLDAAAESSWVKERERREMQAKGLKWDLISTIHLIQ